jgi:hypothetical protein
MRQYIDQAVTLRRSLLARTVHDLRAHRETLELTANSVMSDSDSWSYSELSKVSPRLMHEIMEYDAAISAVEDLTDFCLNLDKANMRAHRHQLATKLRLAANAGRLSDCLTLLKHGADANSLDDKGWTPLSLAAANNHVDVCIVLIQNGGNPSLAGNCGKASPLTPFQIAVESGASDVVAHFLEHQDEDHAQRTTLGRTMSQLASEQPAVKQLLKSARSSAVIAGAIGGEDAAPEKSNRPSSAAL